MEIYLNKWERHNISLFAFSENLTVNFVTSKTKEFLKKYCNGLKNRGLKTSTIRKKLHNKKAQVLYSYPAIKYYIFCGN